MSVIPHDSVCVLGLFLSMFRKLFSESILSPLRHGRAQAHDGEERPEHREARANVGFVQTGADQDLGDDAPQYGGGRGRRGEMG